MVFVADGLMNIGVGDRVSAVDSCGGPIVSVSFIIVLCAIIEDKEVSIKLIFVDDSVSPAVTLCDRVVLPPLLDFDEKLDIGIDDITIVIVVRVEDKVSVSFLTTNPRFPVIMILDKKIKICVVNYTFLSFYIGAMVRLKYFYFYFNLS